MACDNCRTLVDISDNFCRHCGSMLTSSPLPVPVKQSVVEYAHTLRPALWKGAVVALAGKALEMTARKLLQRVTSGAASGAMTNEWLEEEARDVPIRRKRDALAKPGRVVRTVVFWQEIVEK